MEAVAIPSATAEYRERLFFLIMAMVITVTVIVAFGLFYVAGISSFHSPWWVHIHAVTFMTWVGFYVLQNTLVFRNNIATHRRLGRIGAGYAVWMIIVGIVLTPLTLAVGRSPPFFTPPYFLALDWMNIIVFGALFYAAIHQRKRTDWHRRLMLCATICLIGPAVGRLIVLSGATMTAPLLSALLLVYVVVAMAFDWLNRGRIHAAYVWGVVALVVFAVGTELLARFPPLVAMAGRIAG